MAYSVVFSYWTTSLDLVERAIKEANIGYVRFDGGVSSKNRELALHRLHHDLSVRVILITVSCGAVGLVAACSYVTRADSNQTGPDSSLSSLSPRASMESHNGGAGAGADSSYGSRTSSDNNPLHHEKVIRRGMWSPMHLKGD